MASRDRDKPIVSAFGRPQGGWPPLTPLSTRPTDGERPLTGALLVPIEQVVPDPHQPRTTVDADGLESLAASIRDYGILQPLLVRDDGFFDDGRTRYTIIAGGRRRLAAEMAGLTTLPVIERTSTGLTTRTLQLIENVQRQNLTPVEEARAFAEMMDLFGLESVRKLADHLHLGYSYILHRLNLLTDEALAASVQTERVSFATATEIGRVADPATRTALLRQDMAEGWTYAEARGAIADLRDAERVARALGDVHLSASALREVAHGMGATDDHVRRASQARRDEPTLRPGDALRRAMAADAHAVEEPAAARPEGGRGVAAPAEDSAPVDAGARDTPAHKHLAAEPTPPRERARPPRPPQSSHPAYKHDDLLALIDRVGGRDNADALLTWGMAHGFDIFTLRQLIRMT